MTLGGRPRCRWPPEPDRRSCRPSIRGSAQRCGAVHRCSGHPRTPAERQADVAAGRLRRSTWFDLCVALSRLPAESEAVQQLSTGVLRTIGRAPEPQPLTLELQALHATLNPGDRLRLSIAGAAWPAIAVNPGDPDVPAAHQCRLPRDQHRVATGISAIADAAAAGTPDRRNSGRLIATDLSIAVKLTPVFWPQPGHLHVG